MKSRLLLFLGRWLERGGRCRLWPLLLTFSARTVAQLVRALHGKSGQANFRCDWSRQVLQERLASDERIQDKEGVFVLANADGLVFAAMIGCKFDLKYETLRQELCVGEGDNYSATIFAVNLSQLHQTNGFRGAE